MAANDVTERFREYLREHGLPVTAQRLAIADVLLHSDGHLSAEEILLELAGRNAGAGMATVYRTIELLLRSGLLVERDFGEGFKRYEPARDEPHHEHLLCSICGRVVEFRDERLERMATLIAESHGFVRQRHRLVVYGICASCQRGAFGAVFGSATPAAGEPKRRPRSPNDDDGTGAA